MQKRIVILSFLSIIFLINWSKESSIPKYCVGVVFLKNGEKQEIVDIAIGTKEINSNKDIIAYKKPENANINPEKYITYTFDLDQVSEIRSLMEVSNYGKEEYINIIVVSKLTKKAEDCIIRKDQLLIGKLKDTGWSVFYPFDQIKRVEIKECTIKEDKK